MVKPVALLLAAALLALTHEQKYATPKEAKAEMCLRGIFQEGGDTAGFIDCSMVRRGVGVIWLAAHIHLSAGREPPPQLPHPCSLFLLDLLVGAAHHPTYNAHPHVHRARPYAALGPLRAHPLYKLHHTTNEAGPQHTPHLHAQTLRPHPRSTLSPPRTTAYAAHSNPPPSPPPPPQEHRLKARSR